MNFDTVKKFYRNVWSESPWLRATGIIAAVSTSLFYLNSQLPSDVSVPINSPQAGWFVLGGTTLIYFFLVAVFSADRLRFERKLRALEQSFRYDSRGTLFNGSQPNIAFRVLTFKGILEGVASSVGNQELRDALKAAGGDAAEDFSLNLPSIHNTEIAPKSSKGFWDELSFQEKVFSWTEYDSATGWGILTGDVKPGSVRVTVTHLQGLLEGEGGLQFSHFLAGYCEKVLSQIVLEHKDGKFSDYTHVSYGGIHQVSDKTVEISYNVL